MKVERTTTGLIIHNPDDLVKRKILQYFSLSNPLREYFIYSGNDSAKLPLFGNDHDTVYISSGFMNVNDQLLQVSLPRPKPIDIPVPQRIEITMNRQPRSKLQEDCIKLMTDPNKRSFKNTIELKPGVGKAEPYSRKIPTPTENGYTKMGDIKLGDYVFDRSGNPTQVIGIFEQDEKEVYKVTFQDGRVAYCCKEHLWTVKTHKNGSWKTMQLQDMIKDFKRISTRKSKHNKKDPYDYKYYIPTCEAVNYPHKNVPIDPWVVGCFIGSGCCTNKKLTISSDNDDIPIRIANIYGFNVKKNKSNYNYIFYHKNGKYVSTEEFFKEIPELIGCYSRDKHIPNIYMVNDVETRQAVLRGLLDANKSISHENRKYNIRYVSISLTLLKNIRWLSNSLGFSTKSIVTNKNKYEIKLQAGLITKQNYFNDLLIKDISYSHTEKCRCIMVDNPEHLYLTEDFIVTHNTFIATYAISILGYKPLIVVPTTSLKTQWVENFVETGINKRDIATNIFDSPNKKITVVTISAIENAMREDWNRLMNVIKEAGFGIKVIDEAHLHLKGMLRFDAICNIRYNWYLSATLGRSDPQEDTILNRALSDAERFIGDSKYEEYQHQYINVIFQDIYYYPSNKLCADNFRYGAKGLIKASYYNMLMKYYDGEPLIRNIINVTKKCRTMIPYGKMVIVMPLLSIIYKALEHFKQDPYFNNFKIGAIDGGIPLSQRREVFDGDIILSTVQSIGTGVDIPELSVLINFDAFKSPITSEQCVGRLRRRKDDKDCYYVDVCDRVRQAKTITNWILARQALLTYFPGVRPNVKQFPDIRS